MAISKYDKKFEYGKILTEGDLNGMVDAINLTIDGVNNADAKSETAIKEATTAKNAVKTLEGLSNSTTAMETLAGQVVQIEENKNDIESLSERLIYVGKTVEAISTNYLNISILTSNEIIFEAGRINYLTGDVIEPKSGKHFSISFQKGEFSYIKVRIYNKGTGGQQNVGYAFMNNSGYITGGYNISGEPYSVTLIPVPEDATVFLNTAPSDENIEGVVLIKNDSIEQSFEKIDASLKQIDSKFLNLETNLSYKADIVQGKNLFNYNDKVSEVNNESGAYVITDSTGVKNVFNSGQKDIYPDEMIKNIRIHPYVGFTFAQATNDYIVSKKYILFEDFYVISGAGASGNSVEIAYYDIDGNYLGGGTDGVYLVDKSKYPEAQYFRFTSYGKPIDEIQLEVGSLPTSFEKYSKAIPKEQLPSNIVYEEEISGEGEESFVRVKDTLSQRLNDIKDVSRPLKVFFLGNSFSVQTSKYFIKLCEHFNLNVVIGISYVGGATLQAYDQFYGENPSAFLKYVNHKWLYSEESPKMISNTQKIKETDWDIIFMQQGSGSADSYETYQPYGSNLYNKIKEEAVFKYHKKAWFMPWAWSDKRLETNTTSGNSTSNVDMYNKILLATKSMLSDLSYDLISPNGAAIQQLYSNGFSQEAVFGNGDGQHLSSDISLFTTGLCLFKSIIPQYYDINEETFIYTDDTITSEIFEKVNSCVDNAILLFKE